MNRDTDDERSTGENSDEEPESLNITLRSLENLVANGKLIDLLFKSKKFREKVTEIVLAVMHSEKQSEAVWDGLNRDFVPRGEFRKDPTKNSARVSDWLDSIKDTFSSYISSPLIASERNILNNVANNFWRSTRSKLGAKIIESVFDVDNPLQLPEEKADHADYFATDEGIAAVRKWLSKHEYGLDERTMRRHGVEEAPVSAKLQKFAIELCKLTAAYDNVASAKEHARKEWKKIYGNGGDGLEATHVENISASGQKRKRIVVTEDVDTDDNSDESDLLPPAKKQQTNETRARRQKLNVDSDIENASENGRTKEAAPKKKPNQKVLTTTTGKPNTRSATTKKK